MQVNKEIFVAIRNHRAYVLGNCKTHNFLTMILGQLTWIYNLTTAASFRLAKKQKLFSQFRDVIISLLLPRLKAPEKQKEKTLQTILTLFPDTLFQKEFQQHEI